LTRAGGCPSSLMTPAADPRRGGTDQCSLRCRNGAGLGHARSRRTGARRTGRPKSRGFATVLQPRAIRPQGAGSWGLRPVAGEPSMSRRLSVHDSAVMVPDAPPVVPVSVVRAFDPPATTYGAGHRGIDVSATTGQPVRAMAAGRVAYVGLVAGIPVVTIRHSDGLRSTYEPVVGALPIDTQVSAGEIVGVVAESGGHCGGTAGCLHVGLRDAQGYRDPTPWLSTVVLKNLPPPPAGGPAGRWRAAVPRTHAYTAGSLPTTRAREAPGPT